MIGRRITILAMMIAVLLGAYAQTAADRALRIKESGNYYYGDGYGATYQEANTSALHDLIGKISTTLSSSSKLSQYSENNNGDMAFNTKLAQEINAYSSATLTNTESLEISGAPEFHVLRYVSRAEVAKMFERRKDKIDDMVYNALRAEEKHKIDDALRYYYWAYLLTTTMQYPEDVKFRKDDYSEEVRLINWLPQRMNAVFENIKAGVAEVNGQDAILYFRYNDQPVTGLGFRFFNGNSWTPYHHALSGLAEIELKSGVDPGTLMLEYEYKYDEMAQHDKEMKSVLALYEDESMPKAQVRLAEKAKDNKQLASKEVQKLMKEDVIASNEIGLTQVKDFKEYNKSIEKVMKAVGDKNLSGLRPLFTEEGWDMMTRLLDYGKAKVLGQQAYSFFELNDGRVACRSITMQFAFPNNHKTFTEDVVFTFDNDKLIEGVTFGLGADAKNEIFDKGVEVGWDETSMLAIVDFLENYVTAFALRRTDYIESIFDDNAYIVTGHKVKKAASNGNEMQAKISDEDYDYTQFTKDEYIKHLRKVFAANDYVNLHFSDNNVVKNSIGGELYSIQIHQDYYSQNYSDTGYLFLLVDINNPKEPLIKVRFWQPERNPNINSKLNRWDPDFGIIGPGNF